MNFICSIYQKWLIGSSNLIVFSCRNISNGLLDYVGMYLQFADTRMAKNVFDDSCQMIIESGLNNSGFSYDYDTI
jgi:hypothetical protein